MKWNKYRMKTTTEAVDMISYTLSEMGIEGIEIEDKIPLTEEEKKSMFIDILPDLGEDDGIAYVSFYIEPEKDHPEMLEDVRAAVMNLGSFVNVGDVSIERSETADLDWINNWKKYWKPFKVDEDIVVKPSWETLPDEMKGDLVIELDPGTAFGTGMHHTTKLCIAQLKKYLKKGDHVFDVGTGSGILSIIAMLLGAERVHATDIDPNAVKAACENAGMNNIDHNLCTFAAGDIITDEDFRNECGRGEYDLVLANILADIIIPLSSVIACNMKPDGIFISSGIINTKEEEVREALLANHFEILETTYSGDWVAFTARPCKNSQK